MIGEGGALDRLESRGGDLSSERPIFLLVVQEGFDLIGLVMRFL